MNMDLTTSEIVFGICFICSGTVLIVLMGKNDWRKSQQRMREQTIIFYQYMHDLGVSDALAKEVFGNICSLDELVSKNNRLKKSLKKANLIHDPI